MPPEVSHHCLITPLARHSPAEIHETRPLNHRKFKASKRMAFNITRLVPILLFLLVSVSLLRFVRILITSSSDHMPSTSPQRLRATCSSLSGCTGSVEAAPRTSLTEKELKLVADLVKHKAPCNLLIFGLDSKYLALSSLNDQGTTILLEDDPIKLRSRFSSSNATRIFKVKHAVPSKRAYNLLKLARDDRSCLPGFSELKTSKCILALRDLPHDVYGVRWDVIIVDGPRGDTPDAPGRMLPIYTAGMLARAGNSSTHVLVHDVDRTIEKWYSRDFLCEENLVSSKGKLWNFRIQGNTGSPSFCVPRTFAINKPP